VNGGNASGESVLHLPKHSSSQVHIMFHQPHPAVFGPAPLVIVPDDILVIGIGVFSQESLHKFPRLISHKPKHNVNMIHIPHVHSDGMAGLDLDGLEEHELVLVFRGSCEL
jgi:hypothetical protein